MKRILLVLSSLYSYFSRKTVSGIKTAKVTMEDIEAEENSLYAQASAELNSADLDEGLWGKALAKGGSNPDGKYVEYRFAQLKAELIQQKQAQVDLQIKRERDEAASIEEAEAEARDFKEKAEAETIPSQRHNTISGEIMKMIVLAIVVLGVVSVLINITGE